MTLGLRFVMFAERRSEGRLSRRIVVLAAALVAVSAVTALGAPSASAAPATPGSTHRTPATVAEPRWVSVPSWQMPRLAIGNDPVARGALVALGALDEFRRSHDFNALAAFTNQRDRLAAFVARRAGVSAAVVTAAWAHADSRHQRVLLAALTQVGVPYRFATKLPGQSFDCSGLTMWAWGLEGVALARTANQQITRSSRIAVEAAQAGDLVYMPGHALIYLGVKDLVLHAPYSGGRIRVDVLHLRDWYRFGNPLRG